MFKKRTIDLSLQDSITVRGYEIKRAPVGQFLKAMQKLENIPTELVAEIFNTSNLQSIIKGMSEITSDGIASLAMKAFGVIPEKMIDVFAELAELDKEKILNDRSLGIEGMLELIKAWIDINGVVNFTRGVADLIKKVKVESSQRQNTGYKE